MSLCETQDLSKTYGDFVALDGLTISVEEGEVFTLLGPNGAGKTTAIRMLMGILQPTRGAATIGGLDCFRERAETKRLVGYVPDEPIFYDYLRGSEILRFVGQMHGLRPTQVQERLEPLLARLDLKDALGEFAVNYSKGMKKKLAVLCALLHDPRFLILDEPTNGLDPFATRELHELMRERAGAGCAVFFSTHLLDQAEKLCDRIAILHRGKLAALGTLEHLRGKLHGEGSLEDVFFDVAGPSPEESPAGHGSPVP